MNRRRRRIALLLVSVLIAVVLGALYVYLSPIRPDITLTGVVLVEDPDPRKQVPIIDAEVRASVGKRVVVTHSGASGYFKLGPIPYRPKETVAFTASHPDYKTVQFSPANFDRLFVIRLPTTKLDTSDPTYDGPILNITNLKIRYAVKATATINIGSIVRSFEVQNRGNVPCAAASVCSPDGKWRASVQSVTYDAGNSNQFTNVRSSCISGPCVFTQVEGNNIANPGRYLHITIRNWSDTVTFLVESEVSRTTQSDLVRQAFPATIGSTMEFTLPATAEGPSIEAELGGTNIIFPLGPSLLLSWATCRQEINPNGTRLFRCELKPSFAFR